MDAVPSIERGVDGVYRVASTRITLDTLVAAFDGGATPEEVVQQLPSLDLADVYAVFAYVLRFRPEVDAYLSARSSTSGAVRRENEARSSPVGVRARLLARRPS